MYCIYCITPKYSGRLGQILYRYLLFQHAFLINPICGFINPIFDRSIFTETLLNYINHSIMISLLFALILSWIAQIKISRVMLFTFWTVNQMQIEETKCTRQGKIPDQDKMN